MSSSQKSIETSDVSSKSIGMEWYDLSPERKIQLSLGPGPNAKWGWAIYRTTFRPDLDRHWDSFKQLVMENIRADVVASDTPELINQMDFVFVEDLSLENADLETLKRRFRAWAIADGTDPTEEQGLTRDTRHAFFIQVDEESLLSFLSNPAAPTGSFTEAKLIGTHVNIVRGWEDGPDGGLDESGGPHVPEDWMKMKATMIAPYFYAELDDATESWYAHYMPPPHGISSW
jgi:hypothetical protein